MSSITLNDVRLLGFKRIWKIVISDGADETDTSSFFNMLRDMSSLLSVCKLVPYGALNTWGMVKDLPNVEAGGLKLLMCDVAPFTTLAIEPDTPLKSKFRNTWKMIWYKFAKACSLTDSDAELISDVGLKLPILLSAMELKNKSAMKLIHFSDTFCTAFGVQLENCTSLYLYNNYEVVRVLCKFYNMVLGWYLSTQNELDTAELISYLVLTDFNTFLHFFESGDRIWLSERDATVNDKKVNIMFGSSLSSDAGGMLGNK